MLLISSFTVYAYDDGDSQLWHTESVKALFNDKWGVYFETEFRYGDDMSEFFYSHAHLQVDYKLNSWMTISPAYRQVYELYTTTKDVEKDWYSEAEPQLNLSGSWMLKDWKIKDRVRFEYRIFEVEDKEDVFRVRNKLTVYAPWKAPILDLNPFASWELFAEEHKTGIYKNRLYLGAEMKLLTNLKAEIYYLLELTEKNDEWIKTNVFGLTAKCDF